MKAIKFPEANINLAENQDEYNTLPAYCDVDENKQPVQLNGADRDPYGEMTVCYEADLTDAEIEDILLTRKMKVWYTGLTFWRGFQPMRMTTINPIAIKTFLINSGFDYTKGNEPYLDKYIKGDMQICPMLNDETIWFFSKNQTNIGDSFKNISQLTTLLSQNNA